MKYIRTKDGRVESWNPNKKDLDMVEYLSQFANYQGDYAVIAQADTIEKLCDEFVIDWLPTNHKDIFGIDEYSKKVIRSCVGNNKTNVYGAIWTNKGLIYVAKLNDKGELELI